MQTKNYKQLNPNFQLICNACIAILKCLTFYKNN